MQTSQEVLLTVSHLGLILLGAVLSSWANTVQGIAAIAKKSLEGKWDSYSFTEDGVMNLAPRMQKVAYGLVVYAVIFLLSR